ncbi:MAG: mechanosensitive ion channel family protein [Mycoplasmoidaceae bacterium]
MNKLIKFWKELNIIEIVTPLILENGLLLLLLYLSYKPIKILTTKFIHKILELKKIDSLLKEFLTALIDSIIIIFYVLNLVHILRVETTTLLTMIGSIGIDVGLALKGSLSDLTGGIQILISKYFVKGNFINVAGVEGTVQKITLLYTVLHTPDNKVIIIPNGKLSSGVITNVTANDDRRVDFIFSTSYETNAKKVRDILFDLPEIVKDRFDEEGIEIPYNKLDIYQKLS